MTSTEAANIPADAAFKKSIIEALESKFKGKAVGAALYVFDNVGSTMDVARDLDSYDPAWVQGARGQALEAAIILSREQTQGRGREARRWFSARDAGIYVTFVFDSAAWPETSTASLVSGLAVLEAVTAAGVKAGLKWPNDVLALDASGSMKGKLAGILCEMSAKHALRIGIGVNLRQSDIPEGVPAASIEGVLGRSLSYAEFFSALCAGITGTFSVYREAGFAPFKKDCERSMLFIGSLAKVLHEGRSKEVKVCGLNDDGSLRALDGVHEVSLYASDVHFILS